MQITQDSAQVLRLDDTDDLDAGLDDPFSESLMIPNTPTIATKAMLQKLRCSEVIIWRPENSMLKPKFFRIVDKSISLCCGPCGHFFEDDEFDMWSIEHGTIPFSRQCINDTNPTSVLTT